MLKKEKSISQASGEEKAHAVLAALKGGLIDVLIMDYRLGGTVLKLYKEGH